MVNIRRSQWAGLWLALQGLRLPLAGALLFVFVVLWLMVVQPDGIDWHITLRPAIREQLLQGHSPYNQPAYFSPPWALLPLLPFAFLPVGLDQLALALTTLAVFGLVAVRLGAKPLTVALLLWTPQLIGVAKNGQIDWYIPLALVVPRPLGLLLLMAKPQLGLGLAAYWLVDSWRAGGWRRVVKDFWPVAAAFAVSFAVYGFYLGRGAAVLTQEIITWNVSAWPYSIPIGVGLLLSALRHRLQGRALIAGAFFSPYLANYSVAAPLLGLLDDQRIMCAVCASLWAAYWLT